MTDPRAIYRRATEIDPLTAQVLRARADAALRSRRRGWPWLAGGLAVALAAAALAVWTRGPDPNGPATLPLDHVTLDQRGDGAIGGTRAEPVVTWTAGTLDVAVTPNQGVHLTIATPEATIRVVGTRFVVERARWSTTVAVSEGTVHLTCAGQAEEPVTAGQDQRCLPVDPSAVLRRLTEVPDAPADERLATTASALARVDRTSPLWPELVAHQVRALRDAGRRDQALAAARDYLTLGDAPRRAELLSFVARTAYDERGCGAVDPLDQAVRELPPGPEWVLLASCLAPTDPDRARTLLDGVDGWATGPWRDSVDALRVSLGPRR